MRTRIYSNGADRQKAYRERLKQYGISPDSRKRIDRLHEWKERNPGHKRTRVRRFVGVDCEGTNIKGVHTLTLIGDSQGNYVENYTARGLSTKECLDFLIEAGGKNKIVVGYSFGYDVNMILKDFSFDNLCRIGQGLRAVQNFNGDLYAVSWFPGKSFQVSIVNPEGKTIDSVTVYDVFGFFQKAFVKTCDEFNVITPEERKFIQEMKDSRADFKLSDKDKIRRYNHLECILLVRVMDSLRDSMRIADCIPQRWHGAGAIASTLLQKHEIDKKNYDEEKMMPYFLGAYFGGRIQPLQMGEFDNVIGHDIISAYPAVMQTLPSSVGTWKATKTFKEKEKWSIYVVKWDIKEGFIGPFPFRDNVGGTRCINYPMKGAGVYWYPEVKAALKHYGKQIKILKGFYFRPEEEGVFKWVSELYEARKKFKASSDPKERSAQLPIKLGINSLYGKTAQGIGFRGMKPKFQNFFWAGYITSETRARMFKLAMQKPEAIIAFATDGVFSTEKLAEQGYNLGEWEVDNPEYLFLLKAGVYAFGKDFKGNKKTRGHFSKDVDFNALRKEWRKKGVHGKYTYKTTKFFGLKVSLAQDFDKWRKWIQVNRDINFMPSNLVPDAETMNSGKYQSIRLHSYSCEGFSLPYEPKGDWLEGDEGLNYADELDQIDSF